MYEVEKGIPVPPQRNKGVRKYPFGTMEIGDSFLLPEGGGNNVSSALAHYRKKDATRRFTIRTQPDGSVRIWRIE